MPWECWNEQEINNTLTLKSLLCDNKWLVNRDFDLHD